MTSNEKPSGSRRAPSYRIKPSDVPAIKKRIRLGEFLNRIAADYDVNPGRIAEIKKGYRFASAHAGLANIKFAPPSASVPQPQPPLL